jgi:diaminopimelate decarboxylase
VKGIGILFDIIPHFNELQFIDLGGGFKVPYKEGDVETDMQLLASKVEEAFDRHPNPGGRPLQVWFEPGKFMVSECGYFITRVNVMKETAAANFVSVDSGFNHLIRPMFYDAYHRIENISNPNGEPKRYSVVGNICETDTFAWDRTINEVHEGDYLVFYNAGAYGFEMSSNFNSRYKPAEVLVKEGVASLIRRRDTFDDLLRNQLLL